MSSIGKAYRPLRDVVAEEIRAMIIRGDLAAGERLLEDRLAEQLGVSRNPVREAIRSLEATGLVEVVPRRGAYVATVDVEDVRKLLEVRGVLEGWAASQAASIYRSDELVGALTAVIEEGVRANEEGNLVRSAELHRDFHLLIERALDNPYLEQVVQPLRHRTEMVFSILLEERGSMGWHEHEAIRDAIDAGDPAAARDAVRVHLQAVVDGVEQTHADLPDHPVITG